MTPRELEEYRALRATIRERGTARVWILIVGLLGWAGLVTAKAALAALPTATGRVAKAKRPSTERNRLRMPPRAPPSLWWGPRLLASEHSQDAATVLR